MNQKNNETALMQLHEVIDEFLAGHLSLNELRAKAEDCMNGV